MMNNTRFHKGFSTIEMLVAVALFSAIALMCISAMFVLVDANYKARSVKTAMDNLGFTFEDMVRDLRLGSRYYCVGDTLTPSAMPLSSVPPGSNGQDCQYGSTSNSGGVYLAFRNREGKIIFYYFDGTNLKRKATNSDWKDGYTDVLSGTDSIGNSYMTMSSSDITIQRFRFYVYNTDVESNTQPYVVITATVKVGSDSNPKTQTLFSVQTTVSQRVPHNAE